MADPADALMLIASVTFEGDEKSLARQINGQMPVEFMQVMANGKVTAGSLGIVRKGANVSIAWEGGNVATAGSKGSLVVNFLKMDGVAVGSWTWPCMKAGTVTVNASDDRGSPAGYTQDFMLEDDSGDAFFTEA